MLHNWVNEDLWALSGWRDFLSFDISYPRRGRSVRITTWISVYSLPFFFPSEEGNDLSGQWSWRQNWAYLAQVLPLSFLWVWQPAESTHSVLGFHGLRFTEAASHGEASKGAAVPMTGWIHPQGIRQMELVSPVIWTPKPYTSFLLSIINRHLFSVRLIPMSVSDWCQIWVRNEDIIYWVPSDLTFGIMTSPNGIFC